VPGSMSKTQLTTRDLGRDDISAKTRLGSFTMFVFNVNN
jgi:hypothetical protein